METNKQQGRARAPHCLVLAFPAQGHVAPMLQFSKLLDQRCVKITLVSTTFFFNSLAVKDLSSISNTKNISLHTISDGFDDGGIEAAGSFDAYMASLWHVGPQTLAQLLRRLAGSGSPVDCVVYDSVLTWALDVAKEVGILGASFFTQACGVSSIYYHVERKALNLMGVLEEDVTISLLGLPELTTADLPSFLSQQGTYPAILDVLLGQFGNLEKADWVLANTFYELEQEVVDWMVKIWPLKTIGPTVPLMFLDNGTQDADTQYGLSLFKANDNDEACMKWLDDKPKRSIVYISFGSIVSLSEEQMKEMAYGLIESECYFLWVIKESEEAKIPKGIFKNKKGKMVRWCPQVRVLSHEAVGCFVTHCGWNSTLEGLCMGVPMIGVPQWTDQRTNAKLIEDVWEVGVRVSGVDERGWFRREEVKESVNKVMESERGKEVRKKAQYWRDVARSAVDKGGSSENNIQDFVDALVLYSYSKLIN